MDKNLQDVEIVIDLMRNTTGSVVTYQLPEVFKHFDKWQKESGEDWCEAWHNDMMEFVGEEFDWEWMPMNMRYLSKEELSALFQV